MDVPFHEFSAPPPSVMAALATLGTAHLSAIAEAAISILDQRAGDCDLEEDDHSGDPLDFNEAPTDDARPLSRIMPIYGCSQVDGPLNSADASRYDAVLA